MGQHIIYLALFLEVLVVANNYQTLKEIAKGPKNLQLSPKQVLAKSQLDYSKKVLDNIPSNVDSKDKYKIWKRETRDMIPHPDTIEEMWAMEEKVYPSNNFKQHTVNRINNSIEALSTTLMKSDYFKNNAPTWPKWLRKTYETDIAKIRTSVQKKNVGLARVNNQLATEDIMTNIVGQKNFKLNSTVAKRVHAEDTFMAMQLGFTTEITTDDDGRISVPLEGSLAPVYSLDPANFPLVDPEEEYMVLEDTYKLIENIIDPHYKKVESDYALLDRKNTRTLAENIDRLGEGFTNYHSNFILEHAKLSPDPVSVINNGIGKIINKNIKVGNYTSSYDIALDFVGKWKQTLDVLKKRSS